MNSELSEREKNFRDSINRMINFPHSMRVEFFDYWSEPTPAGKKMRFEMEKTWDLNRRLLRWQRNSKDTFSKQNNVVKMEPKITIKEVIELDQLLERYSKHPTSVAFSEFGKYYDFLKEEKLLRPLTPAQIKDIKDAYNDDNFKCRCACVQMTFNGYSDSGFTFSRIFELRQKLA